MASFNSRYLSYEEVSNQFVPTPTFKRLAYPGHSILLGARGCGKTTMLKMLQPEAISVFCQKDSSLQIPFYGVYIPSDRQWSFIIEERANDNTNGKRSQISRALVNLNVLLAFVESLNFIISGKKVSDTDRYNLCKLLLECWQLPSGLPPMLEFIQLQLRREAVNLHNTETGNMTDYTMPFVCRTSFLETVILALDCIDISLSKYNMLEKWALCFDELEIAPEWLKTQIVEEHLRSRDQRIFFKMTATPDWKLPRSSYRDAAENNDIDVIRCWNHEYETIAQWRNFCNQIIKTHVLDKYNISLDDFINIISIERKDRHYYLENLPKVDHGFAMYFARDRGVDDKNAVIISRADYRSKYYNIFILAARYYYYCQKQNKPESGNFSYLGDWMLYTMPDGNPRSLMNFVLSIVYKLEKNGRLRSNFPALGKLVLDFSQKSVEERFLYCPMRQVKVNDRDLSFNDILIGIGIYFRNQLLGAEYNPMPITMFSIDHNTLFKDFVHVALEAGAIVLIEDKQSFSGKMPNGVFRLSYMLYPYFGIVSSPSKDVVFLEEIFK